MQPGRGIVERIGGPAVVEFSAEGRRVQREAARLLEQAARVLSLPREDVLTPEELAALGGRASPEGVIV